jgi:HEAT repeat protein
MIRCQRCMLAFVIATLAGCGPGQVDRLLGELQSPDTATRRRAAQMLIELKPADSRVAAALTKATSDADLEVRRWSCRGLGELGTTSAQSALEGRLKDPEVSVRRAAAFALQQIAPDSTAYREEILAAMRTGDGGVIVALSRMQPPPLWATATLVELLKDRRPGLRRLAAESLGELRPDDPSAATALQKATGDADDRVREAASAALARIAR